MSHQPQKKVCFHCLTHHDACDADAHIPDDVEFVVKEVLDARFTVLQSKSMSHAVRNGCKNIFINKGLKCNLKFSQPTLVSVASVQGLPVVPQQFSWKCDKREVPCYILFSRLGNMVLYQRTYYFLVWHNQCAVVVFVVGWRVEVLNVFDDLWERWMRIIKLCIVLRRDGEVRIVPCLCSRIQTPRLPPQRQKWSADKQKTTNTE